MHSGSAAICMCTTAATAAAARAETALRERLAMVRRVVLLVRAAMLVTELARAAGRVYYGTRTWRSFFIPAAAHCPLLAHYQLAWAPQRRRRGDRF